MAPYRSVDEDIAREAPRDAGIVGDVISQFADPLAFYRELVQNAVDAGTPSVDIRIEHDGADTLRVTVRDRGEGMTREIVEDQLLVLFRSTKEGATGKIGKFGIGFASVLAPSPDVVVVNTSRDGRRHVLHLYRDLGYELFDGGPATATGTTVELELTRSADEVAKFVEDSRAALHRWCRHTSVPIELTIASDPPAQYRIDTPLAIDRALVCVRAESPDGMVALVALTEPVASYGGFFNGGLLLFETTEPLLGKLAFKVQDPALGHTLSRDNVRRDARFDHVMEVVRELARDRLRDACTVALREATTADDAHRHATLTSAVRLAGIDLPRSAWVFRRLHAEGDAQWVRGDELPRRIWASLVPNELTELLAAAGPPVFARTSLLRDIAGDDVTDVEDELTAVVPVERSEADELLLGRLRDLLAATHRAPRGLELARLVGALAPSFAIAAGVEHAFARPSGDAYIVDRRAAERSPFARLRPAALVLNAEHALMIAARQADDPRLAASLLARIVLLEHRALDAAASQILVDGALADVGARA